MGYNTVSVVVFDINNNVLILKNKGTQFYSFIGGWITPDYDGSHSHAQALKACWMKLCQETNNGNTDEHIINFRSKHIIRPIGSITFNRDKFDHLLLMVRIYSPVEHLVGTTHTPGRYITTNHMWVHWNNIHNKPMKKCSIEDIKVIRKKGIPDF